MLFLKYSLYFFNNFNTLFQSRTIVIHKLFLSNQQLIRQVAQNFIIPEVLTYIASLNVNNKNIIYLNDIYMRPEYEHLLATLLGMRTGN